MKDHPRRFLQAVESGMASQPAADGHCAEKPKAIISGQSQAEGMAKFACRVTYQDLTPERRERLKVSILDSLACAIVAIGAPPTAACLAQAKEFGGPDGRCTLIGGGKANVVYAALNNTTLVRYIDYMDSYLAGPELCHPSDNTGAVLAACEHSGRSGSIVEPPSAEKAKAQGIKGEFFIVEPNRMQLEEICRLIDTGGVRVFVDTVLPLEQARQAFERGLKGHSRGKIVLRIAG